MVAVALTSNFSMVIASTFSSQGEGPYYFCLSPSNPADVLPGYPVNELSHVGFGELSGVLSGDGLPSSLGIRLNDPCIPTQTVADFGLGKAYRREGKARTAVEAVVAYRVVDLEVNLRVDKGYVCAFACKKVGQVGEIDIVHVYT